MPRLTEYLTQLRQRSGLSYAALAERAQTNRGNLHRIFSGSDKPRRDMLFRLALALNLDVSAADELLRAGGFPGLLPAPARGESQAALGFQRVE